MPHRHRISLLLLAVAFLATASLSLAQREPVLKQIDVPHPYYFREMYLPQLTTGPSAVAWAADSAAWFTRWRDRCGNKKLAFDCRAASSSPRAP